MGQQKCNGWIDSEGQIHYSAPKGTTEPRQTGSSTSPHSSSDHKTRDRIILWIILFVVCLVGSALFFTLNIWMIIFSIVITTVIVIFDFN